MRHLVWSLEMQTEAIKQRFGLGWLSGLHAVNGN